MSAVTVHFLLVYSHKESKLVSQDEFRDSAKAVKAYSEAERENIRNDDYEIVLIGSDSIETIMKTHGHYFAGEGSFPLEFSFSA
jgi:hypothetical protein